MAQPSSGPSPIDGAALVYSAASGGAVCVPGLILDSSGNGVAATLYKSIGGGATGNVTSFATVLSSPTVSSGSLTIPANRQTAGSMIYIHAAGTIDVSTASQTITFELLLNGTAVASIAVASVADTATSWAVDGWVYCSAIGAAGTAAMYAVLEAHLYGPAAAYAIAPAVTHTTSGVATTGTQALDLQMKFGTSETANTCSCLVCEVSIG